MQYYQILSKTFPETDMTHQKNRIADSPLSSLTFAISRYFNFYLNKLCFYDERFQCKTHFQVLRYLSCCVIEILNRQEKTLLSWNLLSWKYLLLWYGTYSQMVLIGWLIAPLIYVPAFQAPEYRFRFNFNFLWSAIICYGFTDYAIVQVFTTDLCSLEIFTGKT